MFAPDADLLRSFGQFDQLAGFRHEGAALHMLADSFVQVARIKAGDIFDKQGQQASVGLEVSLGRWPVTQAKLADQRLDCATRQVRLVPVGAYRAPGRA